MAFSPKRFCDAFFEALRERYETFAIANASPALSWLNSALIFTSLQECRSTVRIDGRAGEPLARFALHPPRTDPDDPEGSLAARIAYDLVLVNRDLAKYLRHIPEHVTEWLVDFSFSYRKIEEAYGKDEAAPAADFQLAFTAESEIDSRYNKVMEDLLRLFFIPSPVRAMIYRETGQDFRGHFVRMLKAHRHNANSADAHWLFLGIPTYRDWASALNGGPATRHKVHCLSPQQNPDDLEPHDDWWDEAGATL